jgi:hypothetical protein
MSPDLSTSPFFLTAVALALLGGILVLAGVAALFRARPLKFALRTLLGLLFISTGVCAGTIAVGIQGYRALTREDVAARVAVRPLGPQRFAAAVHFPDGRTAIYDLAGDEIYIDAHILKWKPLANMVGLHTVYELDRVEGRYHSIEQERSGVRTVHSLAQEKLLDLFTLRQRYPFFATLVDVEYGSATFATVSRPADLEIRVSTTGLLIRDAATVRAR